MNVFDLQEQSLDQVINYIRQRQTQKTDTYDEQVKTILATVKEQGDKALLEYIRKFDSPNLNLADLQVTREEIDEAYQQVSASVKEVIHQAIVRIEAFHQRQKRLSWFEADSNGSVLGQKITPLESVGVYVPGGTAVYPSSVLMNVLPAKVAGVERIVMVTPADQYGKVSPLTLVAADCCGVNQIYKVGGAQAIAALAYGTTILPKVDKIVGPGNIYVALAKKNVFGEVGIDAVAGPSEVLVLADDTAIPSFVAADLLAQAEHDVLASAILITNSRRLANQVLMAIDEQTIKLSRKAIIDQSLTDCGAVIITETIEQAYDLSNLIAPEHLELCVAEPMLKLSKIKHAGAIFLGNYSPEPLGDYMAGPNHVLPTGGSARFFSPLGVDDFIKKSSVIYFNQEGLNQLSESIITFAEAEQLTAHAASISQRSHQEAELID